MLFLRFFFAGLCASLPLASAQTPLPYSSAAALLAGLPSCALTCLLSGVSASTCSPTNTTCTCTNVPLLDDISLCVTQNCTIKESLVAKNITNTVCGVPVRQRGHYYYVISIVFAVTAAATVVVRFGFKLFLVRIPLTADDWFILATIIAGVPSSVITVHGTLANGLGQDIWTLEPVNIYAFLRFFWAMALLYFLQVMLVKMSLLFFYLRIFPTKGVRKLLWGTVAFNGVFGAVFVLLSIFQCHPVSFFWEGWDGEHHGTCMNINKLAWANASISIFLDVWMLSIPMGQLKKLKLSLKKKIGVGMMFIVGTFVTIVSILRLQSLVALANTANPTWDELDVSIWSTVEISVGIICTCMPSLRLLLVHLIPSFGDTAFSKSGYKSSGYLKYGSASRGRNRAKSDSNVASNRVTASATSRNDEDGNPKVPKAPKGKIVMQQDFEVQYMDVDEQSLVRMGAFKMQDRIKKRTDGSSDELV